MERLARYQNHLALLLPVLGIGFTFAVGLQFNSSSPYSFFLPGILAIGSLGAFLLVNEHVRIGLIFLLFVISLGGQGIGLGELLLGVYSVLFLGVWFFERIIAGKLIFENRTDAALGIFIAVCLMGAVIGLLNNASLTQLAAELFSFCLLLFYFPLREYCRRHENGARNILYMIILCGIYAAVSNAFSFANVLTRSLDARGIATGRVASSEILLYFGTISSLALLSLKNNRSKNLLLGLALTICLSAAILTQFRSIYIGIFVATLILFLLADQFSRRKLVFILLSGAALAIAGAYVLLGDAALMLLGGIADRVLSIGTASEADISFINRFFEYEKVVELVIRSPIAGYGLGVNFAFYDAIYNFTWVKSFVHNAPLHLTYKLGLLGFLSFTYLLYRHCAVSWKTIRLQHDEQPRLFASLVIAAIPGLLAIGLFSVLFNTDTTLPLAALLATHSFGSTLPSSNE